MSPNHINANLAQSIKHTVQNYDRKTVNFVCLFFVHYIFEFAHQLISQWNYINIADNWTFKKIMFSFCFSSVVPVCTSSSQSGQTLYIDTSAGPSLEVKQTCQCDVTFLANATKVEVHYFAPDYDTCGLKFSFTTTAFLCTPGLYSIEPYFEKITFTRDAISQATACLVIYLGKRFSYFEWYLCVFISTLTSITYSQFKDRWESL